MNRRVSRLVSPLLPLLIAAFLLAAEGAGAQSNEVRRRLNFTGMVDAGLTSDFGSLDKTSHATGLEADLITTLSFTPKLNGQVRTTMRDGTMPEGGDGNTWTNLRFDGVQVNWQPGEKAIFMAGDLVGGAGYFQYNRYKRTAALVGEHSLRGAGVRYGDFLVHAGVASDTAGIDADWSVFARWTRRLNENMSWSPSLRYTVGIPGAYPFELGVSFKGQFDDVLQLQAHVGMNYWSAETDPGSLLLIEPRYVYEPYFFAATFFYNDKGEVPSPNSPREPLRWNRIDDFLIQVEPGVALNKTFSVSASLELRNASMDETRDISVWLLPTLYVYPAPRAEWRVWGGIAKPLISGEDGYPQLSLGSEIGYTF